MQRMTRWFLTLAIALAAIVGLLVGVVLSGGDAPATGPAAERRGAIAGNERPVDSTEPARFDGSASPSSAGASAASAEASAQPATSTANASAVESTRATASRPATETAAPSFADVAQRLNPAVVSIEATLPAPEPTRRGPGRPSRSDRGGPADPADPDAFGGPAPRDRTRQGAGAGFLIDAQGHVLTNHHVVDGAQRVTVALLDGRRFKARTVGSDPETDVALLKVDAAGPLPYAPLGNSDTLRVGEWVIAIGNPLAYDHTLTVGVVSFLGRKLFDSALERYIQTDAAITFGNSGGPLLNARGQVVGINTALSSRAASIGFAVPINDATAVLAQLKATGTVSRGYLGLILRGVDADLQAWLGLPSALGAVVQDVAVGSPGARAGVRPYDVIVRVDGAAVTDHDGFIRAIAARDPGTAARLEIVREGHRLTIGVKLAERPHTDRSAGALDSRSEPARLRPQGLGIAVREIDAVAAGRLGVPAGSAGVFVSRVDAASPASTGAIARGDVVLEINRQPVHSAADFVRLTSPLRPGDVVGVYLYRPDRNSRLLQTVRIE